MARLSSKRNEPLGDPTSYAIPFTRKPDRLEPAPMDCVGVTGKPRFLWGNELKSTERYLSPAQAHAAPSSA